MISATSDPSVLPPSSSSTSTAASATATSAALQNANFMQIMLAEITTQDPTQPEDTSQMVQEMESMQQLANTQAQAYQNNLKFAQQMIGQQVSVQEQQLSASDMATQQSEGLNPKVGSATDSGVVTTFKDINQTVYVTVGGYDYPISNVTQVMPATNSPSTLSTVAQQMLGHTVGWNIPATSTSAASSATGVVTGVSFDSSGNVQLNVGNSVVPFSQISQITQ